MGVGGLRSSVDGPHQPQRSSFSQVGQSIITAHPCTTACMQLCMECGKLPCSSPPSARGAASQAPRGSMHMRHVMAATSGHTQHPVQHRCYTGVLCTLPTRSFLLKFVFMGAGQPAPVHIGLCFPHGQQRQPSDAAHAQCSDACSQWPDQLCPWYGCGAARQHAGMHAGMRTQVQQNAAVQRSLHHLRAPAVHVCPIG